MAGESRARRLARGAAIPAFAIFAFGAAGFFSGILSPMVCGAVCAWTPFRSLGPSWVILAAGGAFFAAALLVEPGILGGQRSFVVSGLLCTGLGGLTLEANASYLLFADYPYGLSMAFNPSLGATVAGIATIGVFGTASLALLVIGARHWWTAGGHARGPSGVARPGDKPVASEGILLLALGAANAILDVLFAGCVSSGPCQPQVLVPLPYPLLAFAAGAWLVLRVVWQASADTG